MHQQTTGQRLRLLRDRRDESQAAVGRANGISGVQIGRYERDKDAPGGANLERLASYYGVSVRYLLCQTDDPLDSAAVSPEWERVLRLAAQYNLPPDEVLLAIETYRQVLEVLKARG